MDHSRSKALFAQATQVIPGGVNSPVRAFGNVGMDPIVIAEASGDTMTDVDGNRYLDYICSWGPMIFGHNEEEVLEDLVAMAKKGFTYGLTTEVEGQMARFLVDAYPGLEMVRMVNSGTEATMSAIRLARGFTGRKKIVKFAGCYHGHSDALLVKAGSGLLTFGVPTSLGVPAAVTADTIVADYNDLEGLQKLFAAQGSEIACVIVEPVAGNMGLVPADPAFLQALRQETQKAGALLIFDEVITGFRLAFGGAAEVYGVTPDLVCFGKIIGGGFPVGAYGGSRKIMSLVSPLGGVYQAGTLSGNPLAMQMGLRNLRTLKDHPELYSQMSERTQALAEGLACGIRRHHIRAGVNRFKGMLTVFFTDRPVRSYADVQTADTEAFAFFFKEMLEAGILLAPSQFESWFVSSAITNEDVEKTVQAADAAFSAMEKAGIGLVDRA